MAWADEPAFPRGQLVGMTKREYAAIHIASAMLRWSISDSEYLSTLSKNPGRASAYAGLAWDLADALEEKK